MRVFNKDTLQNLISGLGNASYDKKASTTFEKRTFSNTQLENIYTDDWLGGKIVDIPVDDSFRKWRYFDCPSLKDTDKITMVENEEKWLQVREKFIEAAKWARLYGGAIIYLGVDNHGTSETPLEIDKIKAGDLKYLLVLDRWELSATDINTNEIEAPNYRYPNFYSTNDGKRLHYSRCIRFDGVSTPYLVRQRNQYWCIGVIQRVYDAIVQAQSASENVNSMIYESTIDVIKIPEFFAMLSSKMGESKIIERFGLANLMKSINHTLLLDSKEDYAKVANTFTGLSDLIGRYLDIASAAADIPATRLLGSSPQGMNATGESDTNNYYDKLQSDQNNIYGPKLITLDNAMVRSVLGDMPEDWSFKFEELQQLNELQRADVEVKNSQRDNVYITAGVLEPSIIAKQLKSDETYQHISDEYITSLEKVTRD
jgi:phage-related protein (TIGR01555 family)